MNNIENKIKEKLNQYYSEVNPDEIWRGIQRKRNAGKKRRRAFLLPLIAAAFVTTIVIFWIGNIPQNHNKAKGAPEGFENKKNIKTQKNKEKNIKPDIAYHNKQKSNHIQDKDSKTFSSSSFRYNQNIRPQYSTDRDFEKTNKNKIENNHVKNNSFFEVTKHKTDIDRKKRLKNILAYIRSLHPQKIPYHKTLVLAQIPIARSASLKGQTNNINISLELTPEYTFSHFSLLDKEAKTFMLNKKNSEKFLESFDISFLASKKLYKNFGIYSGLIYSQIDTKMHFEYFSDIIELEDSVLTTVIINSITDTTKIYERTKVNKSYKTEEIIYNYRRYLKIPVMFYIRGNINRLAYEMRAGLDFNIFVSNKGKTVTPEGHTATLDDTAANMTRKPVLGDFHFDLRFRYKINDNIYLYSGPQYKFSAQNLMQKQAGFRLTYHHFGINSGLVMRL